MDSTYVRTGGGYVCRFCNMKTRQLTSQKQKEDVLKEKIAFLEMQLQEKEKIISSMSLQIKNQNSDEEDGILKKIEILDSLISRLNT